MRASEVLAKLENILPGPASFKGKIESYRSFIAENFAPDARPYSDPYHWAAFSLIGCDVRLH